MEDAVGEAVVDGFVGFEPEVAVAVEFDLCGVFAAVVAEDLVEAGAETEDFLGFDFRSVAGPVRMPEISGWWSRMRLLGSMNRFQVRPAEGRRYAGGLADAVGGDAAARNRMVS